LQVEELGDRILPSHLPPVFAPIPPQTIEAADLLTFQIHATSAHGSPIRYSVVGAPPRDRIDAVSGQYSWVPTVLETGIFDVKILATELVAGGRTSSITVPITVIPAPGSPTATIPFNDDFSGDSAIVANPWTPNLLFFHLDGGEARAPNALALTTLNGVSESHVDVSADLDWSVSGSHGALVARFVSNDNYYAVVAKGGLLSIVRRADGTSTELARRMLPVGMTEANVRFLVAGNILAVRLNGDLFLQAHDDILTTGTVGFRGVKARVDNFSAQTLSPPSIEALPFADNFNATQTLLLGYPKWTANVGFFKADGDKVLGRATPSLATVRGPSVANVSLSVDVTWNATSSVGLVARYGGPGDRSFYTAVANGVNRTFRIWRHVDGVKTLLATAKMPAGVTGGELGFNVVGSSLSLLFNDEVLLTASDSSLAAGGVGLRGRGGTFDNFLAT
jgi:hypothetical protein